MAALPGGSKVMLDAPIPLLDNHTVFADRLPIHQPS
jgi:hypothetical protein